jgi:hypothetical protein
VRDRKIIKQCMRQKRPLPEKITNMPELRLGLELYYVAFWDLSTCRPVGLGIGAIPWLAIRDYALAFEFDEEQAEYLFYCVRRMDNAFIEFHSKKKTE